PHLALITWLGNHGQAARMRRNSSSGTSRACRGAHDAGLRDKPRVDVSASVGIAAPSVWEVDAFEAWIFAAVPAPVAAPPPIHAERMWTVFGEKLLKRYAGDLRKGLVLVYAFTSRGTARVWVVVEDPVFGRKDVCAEHS